MGYRAALFDLDDTLLVSSKMKFEQHRVVAKRHYGIDISDETLRRVWGMPFTAMIIDSYQDVDDPEVIRELLLSTNNEFPKSVFEGAADAIDSLLDNDIHVGVVTSAPTKHAVEDLDRLGFSVDRLSFVHGDDVALGHKPDAAVFDLARKILAADGIQDDEMVYVGDLLIDLQCAMAAGLDFIAVTTGVATADEFDAAGATEVFPGVVGAIRHILTKT